MATFILVHGASLGGWCWRKVVPLLEEEGHRVFALDLPGHGDDSTAVSGMTLDANVARIREAVEAADEPVILVGHSMGGIAITQAAEEVPDRIATLVYLAALLPQDGQSLQALAQSVVDPFFAANTQVNESEGTAVIPEEVLRDAAFGECDEKDVEFATSRLVPESLAAMGAPVTTTPERAGSVPRVYVECLRDRTIPIDGQRAMQQAVGCERVLTIDTDHSPFLSRPRELADHLLSLARQLRAQALRLRAGDAAPTFVNQQRPPRQGIGDATYEDLTQHHNAGTFRPGRHGHLLAEHALPVMSPVDSPACGRIWKKLREAQDDYGNVAGKEVRRDIADSFSKLTREHVEARDHALPPLET